MKYTPLLPGQKFNKLKIISLHHKRLYINPKTNKKKYKEFYLCKCDCGNEIVVYKDNLKRNHTTSCGCYKNEMRIKSHTKHGMEGIGGLNQWITVRFVERLYLTVNGGIKRNTVL